MAHLQLPLDCVLVKTADGARKMRSHTADITPKLRSVLFLIDGVQPTQKLLERAGELRPLLESQLSELLRLGLVDAVGGVATGGAAKTVAKRPALPEIREDDLDTSPGIPPLVGAKIQLLRQLEILDGKELAQDSASLVEARSWHDLAVCAKNLSRSLQDVAGTEAAALFWARAKKILVTWRGKEASLERP